MWFQVRRHAMRSSYHVLPLVNGFYTNHSWKSLSATTHFPTYGSHAVSLCLTYLLSESCQGLCELNYNKLRISSELKMSAACIQCYDGCSRLALRWCQQHHG